MIQLFDLHDIQKSPARFDMDKLAWMNQKLVQRATWQELDPHLTPFMPEDWKSKPDAWKEVAIKATQKGKSVKEMAEALAFVWRATCRVRAEGRGKVHDRARQGRPARRGRPHGLRPRRPGERLRRASSRSTASS